MYAYQNYYFGYAQPTLNSCYIQLPLVKRRCAVFSSVFIVARMPADPSSSGLYILYQVQGHSWRFAQVRIPSFTAATAVRDPVYISNDWIIFNRRVVRGWVRNVSNARCHMLVLIRRVTRDAQVFRFIFPVSHRGYHTIRSTPSLWEPIPDLT